MKKKKENQQTQFPFVFLPGGSSGQKLFSVGAQSSKTKKIKTDGYPQHFEFETGVKLPKFKCGCKVRGELLLSQLNEQDVHSPLHAYEDYVVEKITKTEGGEIWHLGS